MKSTTKSYKLRSGTSLFEVIIIGTLMMTLIVTMAAVIISTLKFSSRTMKAVSSSYIAEAGLNYYLWHLSHNVTDYCDGKACPAQGADGYGPFTYNYKNPDGVIIGTYSIYVKPPTSASAAATVKSIGQSNSGSKRTLQASIAIPSFAQYSILTNSEIWIGPGESVDGPLHSNIGVHFDGTGNDTISSAQASYRPSSQFGGDNATHNGVWGSGSPSSLWKFPVIPVDFASVTANLGLLKTQAQANGKYLAPTSPSNPTSKLGYYLELRSDGKIDQYKVTRETCSAITTTFVQTLNHPANDLLYVEDNVWVKNKSGQTFPNRLTIAASYLPANASTYKTITIVGDIKYTAKDGSAAIGLIAQQDVRVSSIAPTNLEINAALLAQTGHVWYQADTLGGTSCNNTVKNSINVYGAIATGQYWTWGYVTGSPGHYTTTDGYSTTNDTYDKNLRFTPPPSFPLTGTFTILNYREVLNGP